MNSNWERINYNNNKVFYKGKSNVKCIKNIICVLCGGLQENGDPNEFVKTRLDKAYEMYNLCNKNSTIILILGGGTYHKPPFINKDNFVVHESSSGSSYLYNKGVNPNSIIREWSSYDTIANGFFTFTNYINYINIDKLTIITSDFHLERSKIIFNYFNNLFNKNKNIEYISVKSNLEKKILDIRSKREKKSLNNFKKNIIEKIKDIESFIKWFYTEHDAYKSIVEYKNNNLINETY